MQRLQACLEALAHQTQPVDDFEVIVVIDGATDGTVGMLADLQTPYALKILQQENQGQNVARNHGVESARGTYCLFLDDDIVPDPELVAEHLRLHRQKEGVVGIGKMSLQMRGETNWYIETYAKGWHQHYEELRQGIRDPDWTDCYGGNFSIARSAFVEVGGFARDIRRSHDVEFGYRLQQHGLKFIYLPLASGRQQEHKTIPELIKDLEKAGTAWVTLCRRHPGMYPYLFGSMVQSVRDALLREILWRLRISPTVLATLGGLFRNASLSRKWFRLINQYSYWRGVRRVSAVRSSALVQGIPVLMYHGFAKPGEAASRFILPVEQFARQMSWLKWLGYHALTMEQFLQHQSEGIDIPTRSVVITIDDGYAEVYSSAYPILKHHGFPATIFIVTGKVGYQNDWATVMELRGRPLLSREQICEMYQNGMQFGAHSRTHPRLVELSLERMREEIVGSKTDLEDIVRQPIIAFAYPFGEYNEPVQEETEKDGFQNGFSAMNGLNINATPSFALHRIEIQGTFSLPRFFLALVLGHTS
jgi:peptidoglycan/xylan/chitin deacetylase (PgdA/CDA1 family)/glycosyltransferase involved in cell wall biosynthesis